jgi:hypothetical protein
MTIGDAVSRPAGAVDWTDRPSVVTAPAVVSHRAARIRRNAGTAVRVKALLLKSTGPSNVTRGPHEGSLAMKTSRITVTAAVVFLVLVAKTSADEIAFTRNVADLANEKLVAKRAK